jgi:hypothetical protein
MFVFMSFETGHAAFAFIAMDWNLAFVDAGYLRSNRKMHRRDGESVAILVDDDFGLAVQLFRLEMRDSEHSNKRHGKKQAAWAAPSSSSGFVSGFSP